MVTPHTSPTSYCFLQIVHDTTKRETLQRSLSIQYTMKAPPQIDSTVMADTESIDKFPTFRDGDVTIIISTSRIYRLHAHTLRQKSSYFKQYLQPESAQRLTPPARRAGHTPWRFQLHQLSHIDGDVGSFIPIVSTKNRFLSKLTSLSC